MRRGDGVAVMMVVKQPAVKAGLAYCGLNRLKVHRGNLRAQFHIDHSGTGSRAAFVVAAILVTAITLISSRLAEALRSGCRNRRQRARFSTGCSPRSEPESRPSPHPWPRRCRRRRALSVTLCQIEVHHREVSPRQHSQRQGAFHSHLLAVQVGRHYRRRSPASLRRPGRCRSARQVAWASPRPSSRRFSAPGAKTGSGLVSCRGASRSHQQRHNHARLQTLARHIPGHDRQAAVAWVRNNLEKVAAPPPSPDGIRFRLRSPVNSRAPAAR